MANEKEKRSKGGINQQRNKKVTKEAKDQWKKPKIIEGDKNQINKRNKKRIDERDKDQWKKQELTKETRINKRNKN